MAFRVIVTEAPDLTTVRLAGRLGDDTVTPLLDTCSRARRPLVLDLSHVTGASEAAVQLLHRLRHDGVHLLGASQYVSLLLAMPTAPVQPRSRRDRPPARNRVSAARRRGGGQRA
jgi:hypothetical protein